MSSFEFSECEIFKNDQLFARTECVVLEDRNIEITRNLHRREKVLVSNLPSHVLALLTPYESYKFILSNRHNGEVTKIILFDCRKQFDEKGSSAEIVVYYGENGAGIKIEPDVDI